MNIDPRIIIQYFYYRRIWKLNPVSSWALACEVGTMKGIKS